MFQVRQSKSRIDASSPCPSTMGAMLMRLTCSPRCR
jgi:hypothetical protein